MKFKIFWLPLKEEILSNRSMTFRSTRLSSTARTWASSESAGKTSKPSILAAVAAVVSVFLRRETTTFLSIYELFYKIKKNKNIWFCFCKSFCGSTFFLYAVMCKMSHTHNTTQNARYYISSHFLKSNLSLSLRNLKSTFLFYFIRFIL